MKYFLSDPKIEQEIKIIKRKIVLHMNAVVAASMTENGIVYKQNYGVSIPQIREIAKQHAKNHDLAQRLWSKGIRETMILATLLEPAEKFTPEIAEGWIADCCQIELIEQLCMNLLSKISYADALSLDCMKSENRWRKLLGFTLSAHIYKQYQKQDVEKVISEALSSADTEDFFLIKALANSLARLTRINKETADNISEALKNFEKSSSKGKKYIYQELRQEILFYE